MNTQFAKVRQKSKISMKTNRRVNNVEDIQSEAATVGTSQSVEAKVNQFDYMLKLHNLYDAHYDSAYIELEDNSVAVITDNLKFSKVEPLTVHIQF